MTELEPSGIHRRIQEMINKGNFVWSAEEFTAIVTDPELLNHYQAVTDAELTLWEAGLPRDQRSHLRSCIEAVRESMQIDPASVLAPANPNFLKEILPSWQENVAGEQSDGGGPPSAGDLGGRSS